jgi:1-acyl-sn-glycerol-3-phosphate acyltransferase
MTLISGFGVIICGILFNPYGKAVKFFSDIWAKSILFTAGTKIVVEGLENVDPEKHYIFIGNHQSHFDVLVLFATLPLTIRFIAKKELFPIPVFGWALYASGMIKIDRGDREKAMKSMAKAIETIRRQVSVAIFAEGTRSASGEILPFKKGGFVMAIKGNIPIIPVSISGSRAILQKHSLRVTSGKVRIIYGKPIDTTGYNYEQREELMERTRKIITEKFDKDYR